jgi:polyphosphate kinase 2 (PPK2 family)
MSDSLKARLEPFTVTKGKDFKLKNHPSDNKNWDASKKTTKKLLLKGTELLRERQEKLYAQDTKGVLLIFQAMDAAGKDGAI